MSEHGTEEKPHKGGGHGKGGHGGHGGGSHEEHEGAPEWLISFADNVTLMMGFFVILLAMNMKPAGGGAGQGDAQGEGAAQTATEMDVAIAIREAFNNPVSIDSDDPDDQELVRRLRQRRGESEAHQPGARGREHDVKSIRPGDYFTTGGKVEFDDGASELTGEVHRTLALVAKQMRGQNLVIELRGHVSAAEAYEQADRGMKLSYERTAAVAAALAADGVEYRRMRLVACADNDRIVATTYDRAQHRINQRVEIIVTNEVSRESASAYLQ